MGGRQRGVVKRSGQKEVVKRVVKRGNQKGVVITRVVKKE